MSDRSSNGTEKSGSSVMDSRNDVIKLHEKVIETAVSDSDAEHGLVEAINPEDGQDIESGPGVSLAPNLRRSKSRSSAKSKLSRVLSSKTKTKARLERPKLPVMDLDKNIVGWEGQDDPSMPLNFSARLKWLYLGLVSASTLMVALASAMIAPGVSFISSDFHNSSATLGTLIVTIFLLGFAIGPILLSPLSEIYGRRIVLLGGNTFFTLWQIGCALAPDLASMIIFRFLAGIGGSASLTIGGGVISDLFFIDERGTASSMYALGTLFGPVLGPILGGFIAERVGWPWVFWVLLIASAILVVAMGFLGRETNHRVLMRWKVEKYRRDLSNPDLRSCYDDPNISSKTSTQILLLSIVRPLKMLFFAPIVLILATYMAFVYGMQYLFSTTIPTVFESTYNFNLEVTGLVYIGLGIGFFCGALTVARINDATVIRLTKANNDIFEPEMRLPACVFFAFLVPITFFWYGWSTYYAAHWSVPIIGLIPFGLAQVGIFVPIQTYVIDCFPAFAASGIAALTIMRSFLGAVLPLAGPKMYDSLGLGWGNSLLAFVSIALIPFPILIYRFGGRVRKRYPLEL